MGIDLLKLEDRFFIHNEFHGHSIFKNDFPEKYKNLYNLLSKFELLRPYILQSGGGKGPIGKKLDTPTHKIDDYKNREGI